MAASNSERDDITNALQLQIDGEILLTHESLG